MTILGADQRGLVRSLASMIEEHQGSWVESRLARLAGQFAGVIRIECPTENRHSLKNALLELENLGIRINLIEEEIKPTQLLPSVRLEIIGNDRPGIIRELSHAIATCGGNVEELVSGVESAAMSGGLLFRVRGVVSFAEKMSIALLQKSIEELSDDLHVSIEVLE